MKKKKQIIGLTYGTFDLFHYGHLRILKRAKALCDYLVVGVSNDEFNQGKNKNPNYTYSQRKKIVSAIKYVDKTIPECNFKNKWAQKVIDIKKHHVDVIIMGDDWEGEFDHLRTLCRVVYLPRTPNISTSNTVQLIKKRV